MIDNHGNMFEREEQALREALMGYDNECCFGAEDEDPRAKDLRQTDRRRQRHGLGPG